MVLCSVGSSSLFYGCPVPALVSPRRSRKRLSPDYAARPLADYAAFAHDMRSVNEDVVDASWMLTRLVIRGCVNDIFRVEYDDIRFHARPEQTPVAKPDSVCRRRRHFPYRFRHIERAKVPAVVSQNSRKGAV